MLSIESEIVWAIGITLALLEVTAIAMAIHAIMYARTSQGAIAWTLSLITWPIASLPFYLVFGRRRFHGYVKQRRSKDESLLSILRSLKESCVDCQSTAEVDDAYIRVLEELGRLPSTSHNRTRLLVNGIETFDAIFAAIEAAEHYILVQFFIVKDDETGREFRRRLTDKARSGMRVYFLYDEIGCHKLSNGWFDELREAGGTVAKFHTTQGVVNRFQINFRNHRKIVLTDGRTAFVGGHNVGNEYVGKGGKFAHWRDTHMELEGPAALGVQISFAEDWFWATHSLPELHWTPHRATNESRRVLILPTGPADRLETCGLFFVETINSARSRVWITSPYFVPDSQIMTALHLAALRGVDVRIMLPSRPDHLLVYLSSFTYLNEFRESNVKFYRYEKGFLHQKVILTDEHIAGIGTANLDNRSFRLNFEITAVVINREFAEQVSGMLKEDFEECVQVDFNNYDARPIWFKMATKIARLLSPIQ